VGGVALEMLRVVDETQALLDLRVAASCQ
jgi:hypothetical protein